MDESERRMIRAYRQDKIHNVSSRRAAIRKMPCFQHAGTANPRSRAPKHRADFGHVGHEMPQQVLDAVAQGRGRGGQPEQAPFIARNTTPSLNRGR